MQQTAHTADTLSPYKVDLTVTYLHIQQTWIRIILGSGGWSSFKGVRMGSVWCQFRTRVREISGHCCIRYLSTITTNFFNGNKVDISARKRKLASLHTSRFTLSAFVEPSLPCLLVLLVSWGPCNYFCTVAREHRHYSFHLCSEAQTHCTLDVSVCLSRSVANKLPS